MLADPGRENQAIKPAEGRHHSAQLALNSIHKQIYRLLGPSVARSKQLAHVVAHPGDTEKSALAIEQLLGVSGISNDMRELLASRDTRAEEAVDLFVYRVSASWG